MSYKEFISAANDKNYYGMARVLSKTVLTAAVRAAISPHHAAGLLGRKFNFVTAKFADIDDAGIED